MSTVSHWTKSDTGRYCQTTIPVSVDIPSNVLNIAADWERLKKRAEGLGVRIFCGQIDLSYARIEYYPTLAEPVDKPE